jgi:hypothetical protein
MRCGYHVSSEFFNWRIYRKVLLVRKGELSINQRDIEMLGTGGCGGNVCERSGEGAHRR